MPPGGMGGGGLAVCQTSGVFEPQIHLPQLLPNVAM